MRQTQPQGLLALSRRIPRAAAATAAAGAAYWPPAAGAAAPRVGPLVAGVLGALLLGLAAATGSVLLTAVLVGAAALLLALGSPRLLFWGAVVGSLVAAGLFELYVPALTMSRHAFALAATLFLVAVLLRNYTAAAQPWARPPRQPALTWLMLGMLLLCAATLVLNWRGFVPALLGMKNYFQAWGLFFGLALMPAWPSLLRTLPRALLAMGFLQMPFVVHQLLVLVPLRKSVPGLTALDVVAGTFGGLVMQAGGNNATMSMFLIILACVLAALWRLKVLGLRAVLLAVALLVPVALNESKISVVYLALGFAIVFRREIVERPGRFLLALLTMAALVFALVWTITATYQYGDGSSISAMVEKTIRGNSADGEKYGGYSLNRLTAIKYWAGEQHRYDIVHTLLGHGPSASKSDPNLLVQSTNLASLRYSGMGIGLTSASSLLWDFGLVGMGLVMAIYVAAFRLAGKLARAYRDLPYIQGLYEGCQAAVAIMAVSLLHMNYFTFQLGYQVLTMIVFGLLVAGARWKASCKSFFVVRSGL